MFWRNRVKLGITAMTFTLQLRWCRPRHLRTHKILAPYTTGIAAKYMAALKESKLMWIGQVKYSFELCEKYSFECDEKYSFERLEKYSFEHNEKLIKFCQLVSLASGSAVPHGSKHGNRPNGHKNSLTVQHRQNVTKFGA